MCAVNPYMPEDYKALLGEFTEKIIFQGGEVMDQLIKLKDEIHVFEEKNPLSVLQLLLKRTLNCPEFGNIMLNQTYHVNELLLDTIAKATEKNTLRLILWTDCERNCQGCCNNDINMSKVVTAYNFSDYKYIMLTGGEPLLYPDLLMKAIEMIRKQNPIAKLIIYTSCFNEEAMNALPDILKHIHGMTVTLHEQDDVQKFLHMLERIRPNAQQTFRLNVFKGILLPPIFYNLRWTIKENIVWIKDCPLPTNEVLKRMPFEF